jgi:EAL domain-containing protein (putative c-di-GMP-specific phosphodiesterase class I)
MINNMTRGKEILMKFPTALANNEFLVYYQPKVELHSNKLAGAEALVRWRVGSEIVPPIQFLPMLERNGEICRLDFYVFETVCRDIRGWMDEKRDIPVISSNFSRWHLRDKDFVDELLRIADKYGVDHKYLEIEVTETTNIEEYSTLRDVVKKIKDNGLSVSIDDFGTGYSSLNMLKEVPVDVLKMDKSLLDQKNNPDELHANDKIMIKHIVGLASDMGIKVLSEGVETIEQREFLKNVGCDYIQGYLYDRPMPEEEFISRIKHPVYEI